jgi:hypothetical protein
LAVWRIRRFQHEAIQGDSSPPLLPAGRHALGRNE